jgi:hypothetical protein
MSGAPSEGKDVLDGEGDTPPIAVKTKISLIIEDVSLGKSGTYCKYGKKVICNCVKDPDTYVTDVFTGRGRKT